MAGRGREPEMEFYSGGKNGKRIKRDAKNSEIQEGNAKNYKNNGKYLHFMEIKVA